MKAPAKLVEILRVECQLGEHPWCRPGEVRTTYGDLAIPARRCDCPCHAERSPELGPSRA